MSETQPSAPAVPSELYGIFAGAIDMVAVQRFHNAIALASAGGVKQVHVLFQSAGGLVGDGISLYNLFRVCPFEITLYNVGAVCSIAAIAFLGATHRKVSRYGAFMVHKAYMSPVAPTADRLLAAADQMLVDDQRIEAILKLHTNIPAEKWEIHKYADVWFSADEAINFGFAQAGEFAPPPGTRLFNIWPPQN